MQFERLKLNKADLFVRFLDDAMLKLSEDLGYKLIIAKSAKIKENSRKVVVLKYKYDPENYFKGPIVVANKKNYKELMLFLKKHPNRALALAVNLNDFLFEKEKHVELLRSVSSLYPLPLYYVSSASKSEELLSPLELSYAVDFFYRKDHEKSKIYKGFEEKAPSIFSDERYFERL